MSLLKKVFFINHSFKFTKWHKDQNWNIWHKSILIDHVWSLYMTEYYLWGQASIWPINLRKLKLTNYAPRMKEANYQ